MKFNNRAFSLIEMMFVIILIAVIALYAVNVMKKRSDEALATKTATDMQQWLQAAQNYYGTKQKWPPINGQDGGWNALIKENLLPASSACSSILMPGGNSPNNCNNYSNFALSYPGNDNEKAAYASVILNVPSEALAKNIASKLPNSNIIKNNNVYTVSGSVTADFVDTSQNAYYVSSVSCAVTRKCPGGYLTASSSKPPKGNFCYTAQNIIATASPPTGEKDTFTLTCYCTSKNCNLKTYTINSEGKIIR